MDTLILLIENISINIKHVNVNKTFFFHFWIIQNLSKETKDKHQRIHVICNKA